jgi:hypothetical protein
MMKSDTPITTKMVMPASSTSPKTLRVDMPRARLLFTESILKSEHKLFKKNGKPAEDQTAGLSPFVTATLTRTDPAQAPATLPANMQMAAHIEKIAAAIAEVTKSGAAAEIQLILPTGATLIDGAIIGRNDQGGLHIILTSHGHIPPTQAAFLQSSLQEHLRQRDIRVSKLALHRVDRRR